MELPNGETWLVHLTVRPFTPIRYQHTAGLILYYDNMNFIYLYKYFSETLNHSAISVLQIGNGEKKEFHDARTYIQDGQDIGMRLEINGRKSQFKWSVGGKSYTTICTLVVVIFAAYIDDHNNKRNSIPTA